MVREHLVMVTELGDDPRNREVSARKEELAGQIEWNIIAEKTQEFFANVGGRQGGVGRKRR